MKARKKSRQMREGLERLGSLNIVQKIAIKWLIKKLKIAEDGTMIKKIWDWFDGNKSIIGGYILALSIFVPQFMNDFNIPMNEGTIGGMVIVAIGGLHKLFKLFGWVKPAKSST